VQSDPRVDDKVQSSTFVPLFKRAKVHIKAENTKYSILFLLTLTLVGGCFVSGFQGPMSKKTKKMEII